MGKSCPEIGPNLSESDRAQHGHEDNVNNECCALSAVLMLRHHHVIGAVERENHHYSVCNARSYDHRCLKVEVGKGVPVRGYR